MTATHIGVGYVQRSLLSSAIKILDRRAQQITDEVGCEWLPSTVGHFGTYMPRNQGYAVFRVRIHTKELRVSLSNERPCLSRTWGALQFVSEPRFGTMCAAI
jgi:hypothetical protein